MATAKKRPRARSHPKRVSANATPVAKATPVRHAGGLGKFDPKATPLHPGLRKGCQPWYAGIGRGYDRARWRFREQINEAGAALAEFLGKHADYVPPAYVSHITKAARSTFTRAAARGDIRSARFTLPSGHRIVLVHLGEALKLG